MKQYSPYTGILFLLVVSLAGCEKYLEISPKTQLAPENLYDTKKGALLGIKGVYQSLREATMAVTWDHWLLTEVTGDDMLCHSNKDERQNLDKYLITSENIILLDQWQRYYKIIANANSFIDNMSTSPVDDQDFKDQVMAEARFARAYAYFMLVRLWGDVPLIVKEVKANDEFFVHRSSAEEVYNQIKADLKEGEDQLPESYTGNENTGRATKGAAKSLLAKVHLTLKEYDQAALKASEVTGLGYQLLDGYLSVFSPEGNSCAESIFEVQALTNTADMQSIMGRYWSPATNILGHKGSAQYTASEKLYGLYAEHDERKSSFILEMNKNANKVLPFTLKYLDPRASSQKQYGTNFHLIRYAEILLTLAEAENEMNGPTDIAYNAINEVRRRAGLNDLAGDMDQTAFRKEVLTERRKELYFEGERWFDLVRTGTLKEFVEATPSGTTADYFPEVQLDKHLLFPVPAVEIQTNPNLAPNNPGY